MADELTERLASLARGLSAAGFGVADVAPFDRELATLRGHKESGRSGPLRFTYDKPEVATDVTASFPWARSLLVVSWDYLSGAGASQDQGATVGRFATSNQYEEVRRIASSLADHLRAEGFRAEILIDDNRLVDRAAAVRAGVGWSGKSTMVLAPGHGPWLLLGAVVTDAWLERTRPMQRDCGACVACLPACPTGALTESGLDARRCLSTWLQTPGSIPQWIRPHLGRRVYGCDDCLVACPPGHRALEASQDGRTHDLPFAQLLASSDDDLLDKFSWWYVPRRQGRFIRRNLLVAAGNSGEAETRDVIESHLSHPSSMIRGHAYWAMARGFGASGRLRRAIDSETVPEARDELILARLMVEHPEAHAEMLEADEQARSDVTIRGLAMVGPHAAGEGSHEAPELVVIDAEGGGIERLRKPVLSIYDPDRVIEEARRAVSRGSSMQPVTYA